ncbi:TIGR01777 family oxidoreductase [Vibrio gallicus]|uniref:TIGR01777 family oxidoreductase n=1 Tax=Vibrio gallicus TaxID=190897 RepID=UPI0021C46EB3|nr:TIGR01777 family oxidoreductase [Vibrio gallicus]
MQILMTGGTGFVGKALIKQLLPSRITILTRDIELAKKQLHHFNSNYFELIDSLDELDNLDKFDAVINLAGEPIVERRWSATQKQRICSSRWQVTEKLVELICCSDTPPAVFISGSAVGIYGDQGNTVVNEQTECPTSNFPFHVCSQWEAIALKAQSEQTRVCLLRTGVVLGLDGGALKKMQLPYKMGLGGPIGNGQQYMPWIHLQDMVCGIQFVLEDARAYGAFNLVAPHPVTNSEFSQQLAKTLKRPHFLFTPKLIMKLLMGESSCLLLDSVNAKPVKLTELGYQFTYSRLQPALRQIFSRS